MIALLLLSCGKDAADTAAVAGPEAVAEAGEDLLVTVGEPVTLDGSASENAVSFSWNTGDGGAGEGEILEHTFAAAGHFTVSLEVSDAEGRTDVDTLRVTAVYPLADPAPRASGALVGEGGRLFAALPDFDRVAVVDPGARALEGHLETCAGPAMLSASDALLAVSCPGDDAVDLFELGGEITLRARVALPRGSRPYGVAVGEGEVYAVLQGPGELLALSDEGEERWRLSLGSDPRGLAVRGEQAVVTRFRSPDGEGRWWLVDLAARSAEGFALAPDPGPDSDTDARGVPNLLQAAVIRPDGRAVVLPGLKANIERGLARDGLPLEHDVTVRADLRHLSLIGEEAPVGEALEEPGFDNRDLALAAAYSPLGDVLFVAHQGAGMIDALDAWSLQRAGGFQSVGVGLRGLWVDPGGEALWALAEVDRALTAWAIDDLSAAPEQLAEIDLRGGLPEALDEEVLLGKRVFHNAGDTRMSQDGYISCASCHLDGDNDGLTWDFTDRGEGWRNTTSLLGRGGDAHGPIHWSGNFDEIQDFENDMRGGFGGTGFLSEEDWAEAGDTLGPSKAGRSPELDALAAYVASLEAVPRSLVLEDDGALSEAALRGEALFISEELGCADCHPPPEYTDSSWRGDGEPLLHDVGTLSETSGQRLGGPLEGIDTPTLRGVHAGAPYLHDGSAWTLEEVLVERNPDDLHGRTGALSAGELADLITFLESLE